MCGTLQPDPSEGGVNKLLTRLTTSSGVSSPFLDQHYGGYKLHAYHQTPTKALMILISKPIVTLYHCLNLEYGHCQTLIVQGI